jgi:dolichyl-phosphate beta-glucosyltransferase
MQTIDRGLATTTTTPEIGLSVVIPAYNEERRLEGALDDAFDYLATYPDPWEVLVVDDGSRDGTADIVRAWQREHPELTGLTLPSNRGKGEAVRQGLLAARGRYRLFLDADRSIPLAAFERFRPHLAAGAPVVVGIRVPSEAELAQRRAAVRRLLGRGFTLLCRAVLAPGIRDYTCGFKCFSADAAREILARQTIRGWAFDAELLYLAVRLGYPVVQEPVPWRHDPGSRVRVAVDLVRSLGEVTSIRTNAALGRYRLPGRAAGRAWSAPR